jgi:hypothetical protein
MLKKLVVGAIAAGVLAVPLAGVAGADPSPDNPGTPGNFGAATTPGSARPPGDRVSEVATAPKDLRPPGTSVNDIAQGEVDADGDHFANVGDAVNDFAPPNFP